MASKCLEYIWFDIIVEVIKVMWIEFVSVDIRCSMLLVLSRICVVGVILSSPVDSGEWKVSLYMLRSLTVM